MIINKEVRKKIQTIATKMEILDFGSKKELVLELIKRYIDLELKKLNLEGEN